ncbi:Mov34/MPN/PAD-1 family protein [Undibacterium sp. WLHG33]|uniref:Mov34/MPN/PAD-1 family protein n=1 Tax=Undibacterium sp. WLHG33 TaxID=3412482 RepID=UPI003C2C15F6
MPSRIFNMPDGSGLLVFTETVLEHMYHFAQVGWLHREAGGQLFCAEPHLTDILIDAVTGPNSKDMRRRCAFIPNVAQANVDRHHQFAAGRHAVGLWHTHPERFPTPSLQDLQTAREYLDAFTLKMDGFLLVVLGNYGSPLEIAVWLVHNKYSRTGVRLTEV